ncbi:hypothetical protein UFOVP121_28 [uncultured Caudovirales phage]|uniref:Uncharacterized protein n=1 Tax=uncultured Caudovirales phage TaxID=2100421 RepID=A0A6J5LC75_9CAUD|nr:hypothetical protein UFOVP121_28 [uncultured Caudovirales phage]CAB4134918.1 hypothetical protein UFOVP277_33 [uncultured Caudovirales phage]
MNKRIYIVSSPAGQTLVEAASQAQAIGNVVGTLYTARIAKPKEIVELMQSGQKPADTANVNVIANS